MFSCQWDIGPNLVTVIVTLVPLLIGANSYILNKVHKEVRSNGGSSMKDVSARTDATISAIATSLDVPHETPPNGTPVTIKEVEPQ
jgi:hypothetical protein